MQAGSLSMLCLSCRASKTVVPIELLTDVWEEIAKHLDGNDKVRPMPVPMTVKKGLSPLGVSAAGLLVCAGQPGSVLQIHAAHVVRGHRKRAD